ncbi:hypothetical protein [Aliarcobacter trophiarum]|nr:hypothetical protein [Aliarcobacter trophiarum]
MSGLIYELENDINILRDVINCSLTDNTTTEYNLTQSVSSVR